MTSRDGVGWGFIVFWTIVFSGVYALLGVIKNHVTPVIWPWLAANSGWLLPLLIVAFFAWVCWVVSRYTK